MIETPAAKYATWFAVAALFSAQPFGISISDMGLGIGFAIVGVIGRGFVDMQKTWEKGDSVNFVRSFGWMGAGIMASPLAVILWLAIMAKLKYPPDAFAAVVLIIAGYLGPKFVSDAVQYVSSFLPWNKGPQRGDKPGGSNGGN